MPLEKLKLLNSDNPDIRISGIESFFNSELDSESADALSKLVMDQDKGVRNALLLLFSNNNNPEIPWKVVQFIKSKELSVKNFAGELLVKIGPPAIDAMLDFLDKGDNDDIKFIIDLLGLIRDKKSTRKVLKILKNTWDSNIGISCIEALGNIWDYSGDIPSENGTTDTDFHDTPGEIIKSLMEYYSANELFRPTVIESIGKIGLGIKTEFKADVLEFVQSKFNLGDDLTRLTVIECLGKIGDRTTFYFLLEKLKEVKGFLNRETIKSISLLKERLKIPVFPNEEIIGTILNTLIEGEYEYKRAAVYILPSIESKAIMIQCLKLLNGCADIDDLLKSKFFEKTELLYEAAAELLSTGDDEKKPLLMILNELWKNSGEERIKFRSSPQRMNLINAVINSIQSPDEEVRISAGELLFIIDEKNSVYFLEELTDDPNIWNRLKIIDMLEKILHPRAYKILARLASDKEEMVREKAKAVIELKNSAITIKD